MYLDRTIKDIILDKLEEFLGLESQQDVLGIYPNAIDFHVDESAVGKYTFLSETFEEYKRQDRNSTDEKGVVDVGSIKDNIKQYLFQTNSYYLKFDISKVGAISASKSTLADYPTLKSFGNHMYDLFRNDHANMSDKQYMEYCLDGALANRDLRFLYTAWAPGIKWLNNGGSHRFSTAYYMSLTKGLEYDLKGKIDVYRLNREFLDSLCDDYQCYIFTVPRYSSKDILRAFRRNDEVGALYFNLSRECRFLGERPTSELAILAIPRNMKIPRVAKRWLLGSVIGRNLELQYVLTNLYKIEDESLPHIEQLIIGQRKI